MDTGKWVRVDPWDTGFVDLDGNQGILGQAEGRTSKTVIDWLLAHTPEFREGIDYVAIDPAVVYAKAVRAPDYSRMRLWWSIIFTSCNSRTPQ